MPNHATQLIEAVPNFSEGRRQDVIDAIAAAIQTPGVQLLDRTQDEDHNRMVLTVAGAPSAVMEGLFRAVATAASRIDMFAHQGAHPRLGATDVVPLIPIQGISLEECAALARELGRRIGDELQIPVFLYEAAAAKPERRNLADVRRGEFEGLLADIQHPDRKPDFGPAEVGSAGATIVGARHFLIAYNFYLTTADVAVAKRIAAAIRERGGGLPAVKALGILVDGRAQVSVNLVDYKRTPLHAVMEAVSEHAKTLGVQVDETELIGLLPEEAVRQTAAHYLKLPELRDTQIIENAVRLRRDQSAPSG